MIRTGFFLAFILCTQTMLLAQNPRSDIRKGNEAYRAGEFDKANELYGSHQKDEKYGDVATFNNANSNYKLEKFEEAINQFKDIANRTQNKDLKARAYHNLGNSFMKTENYKESVEAYKNALRNNPTDEESRHNLALAKRKLQEQENQNQDKKDDQNKDKEDKKDENKKEDENKNDNKDDNKDGDKNEDKKDKKEDEKDQKDGDKKDEEKDKQQEPDKKQEPKAKPNELSKEDAQRMLDAMQNNEKGTQEKVNQKRVKVSGKTIEKDW